MKIERDMWSLSAVLLLVLAALVFTYKPFTDWSWIVGINLAILSVATAWGRAGYISDKSPSEKAIEKAKFWAAVLVNVGVLLAVAGDA